MYICSNITLLLEIILYNSCAETLINISNKMKSMSLRSKTVKITMTHMNVQCIVCFSLEISQVELFTTSLSGQH